MPITFLLKKIISVALTPPVLPITLTLVGLVLLGRRPRLGKILLWSGLIITVLLATPFSVDWLIKPLEMHPVITEQQLHDVQAIVILAGGKRSFAPEYGSSAPTRLTLERIRYGASLAKRCGLPVLASGGAPTGEKPEAALIAESLKKDFGVNAKWIEDRSLDTQDNAIYSVAILKKAGIKKIALVTHSAHMRRAVNEFVAQGIEVVPAPTVFFSGGPGDEEFLDFIPNMSSAYAGWYAMHEWLGLGAQWVRISFGGRPPK